MKFNRKGEGRIYTDKEENIPYIMNIIFDMDQFEFEYLPKDLITVYEGQIQYVYNHKFDDINLDKLMKCCWDKGIFAFYAIQ